MLDERGLSIPEYFPQDELDKLEMDYFGRVEPLIKEFDGVEVRYSSNTTTGCFLTFKGLKLADGLCLSVDGDQINEITHLILKGNSIL